ncbi:MULTISPECIES: acyl-CoA dehydrogenase family protein [unclassified Rhodococcus (in: high G+C Gram-positive bacteria)]|uniref:acyl-CoA dehydrogenase family protein n=1 Tax=unclassified Rhodococcus (in: high G+C Gram-positive bacteria) TaxID=192944 RepID=UPI000928BD61|nr:acyl-CoA dehydrogenase family protein [Rhodococcus sp. M8]OLL20292.1 acyl-CoA dehydrogenase [Rhodococcus sp. M8]QPG44146.1 acyl-CoA/acyl-ACP dehydrogenase [Rhodococcus sp. M8]
MLISTPEQDELRSVVRRLLDTHSSEQHVRSFLDQSSGFDVTSWKLMADQIGVQALAIPEEYGGAGFGFAELAIVLEESGRALLCAPLLSTCVLATYALLLAEDSDAAAEHLPGIAAGDTIATLAATEGGAAASEEDVRARAELHDGSYRVTGVKSYVLDGADADLLIVAARTDRGVSLFTVDAHAEGVTTEPLSTLDRTRNLATITLDSAPASLLGTNGHGWTIVTEVLEVGAAALAAEQVGGAARVLESTVEYAKMRQQFGRPIGSFQAIKHQLADMLVELESARSAAYYATGAVQAGSDDRSLASSIAKTYCSDAYYHIAAQSIQIHGGIGFTWEHPAHLYFKRARGSQTLLGSPGLHRNRIADLVGL